MNESNDALCAAKFNGRVCGKTERDIVHERYEGTCPPGRHCGINACHAFAPSTEATFDAKTLDVGFDQIQQAVDAWYKEPGFVKVLLEKREADAMLAFYKARKQSCLNKSPKTSLGAPKSEIPTPTPRKNMVINGTRPSSPVCVTQTNPDGLGDGDCEDDECRARMPHDRFHRYST